MCDANCSDLQSFQISDKSDQTGAVHRKTSSGGSDDSERQNFCPLLRVTIHRRLHVTGALRSTTKHFHQRTAEPV